MGVPFAVHVALVTETYPPEVNGVAMTLSRLVAGLRARGHVVDVLRPRQSRDDLPALGEQGDEIPLPGMPLPGYPGLHLGLPCGGRLRRRWAGDRPDVVHVATEGPLGWSARRAARALGIPLASSFHTNFHTYSGHYASAWFRGLTLATLRRFHNGTRVTLVPSEDVRRQLEEAGFRDVQVMGRGVDTALFSPARRDPALRASWGADESTPVAIYVGRVAAEKNLPLTIDAWQAARAVEPALRLVVVGDGPLRPALERRHPEIVWTGTRTGEDLARHYASGDLFLFASTSETFGNVVTEGLASGLLVVGYDYAAARRHVRHGESGLLVPFGDNEAFVAAAAGAMRARDRWPALRQAARRVAEGVSWGAVVGEFEKVLVSVTSR